MTNKPEIIFKPGEEYEIRGGEGPARIYVNDAGGNYPIHGAVYCSGYWRSMTWDSKGIEYVKETGPFDLMPPKPKPREVWIWDWDKAGLSTGHFTTPEAAASGHNPDKGRAVKFREVLEND